MSDFTPLSSVIGGVILGFSAVLLLLFNGRVMGISGIFNDVLSKERPEIIWKSIFLSGVVLAPLLASYFSFFLPKEIELSWSTLIIGAFLVGFGTNLGSGCTSGHGICGIGRLSKRSIFATITFMLVATATVTFIEQW